MSNRGTPLRALRRSIEWTSLPPPTLCAQRMRRSSITPDCEPDTGSRDVQDPRRHRKRAAEFPAALAPSAPVRAKRCSRCIAVRARQKVGGVRSIVIHRRQSMHQSCVECHRRSRLVHPHSSSRSRHSADRVRSPSHHGAELPPPRHRAGRRDG